MMRFDQTPIQRWDGKALNIDTDHLASERILEIRANSKVLTRLLCSKGQEIDLAIGHLLSEGFCMYDDINSITFEEGIINIEVEFELKRLNYSEIVSSSCGACDRDEFNTLSDGIPQSTRPLFSVKLLAKSLEEMRARQVQFAKSGGMHCSALVDIQGVIHYIAEDIGRHNATDKVIGMASREGKSLEQYGLLLSGRCAWDLCSKAIRTGVACVASIGAISDLAAETARANLLPLAGFLRESNGVIIGKFQETNEQH